MVSDSMYALFFLHTFLHINTLSLPLSLSLPLCVCCRKNIFFSLLRFVIASLFLIWMNCFELHVCSIATIWNAFQYLCVSLSFFFLGCVMFLLDNIAESSLCYCIVHSIVAAILSFRNGLFGRRFVGVVAAVVVFVFFFSVLPYSASVQ